MREDGPVPDQPWRAPTATGPVRGRVTVPGSKSLMARHLVLAATATGTSVVEGALHARDSVLMADALTALGCVVDTTGSDWTIEPAGWGDTTGTRAVDCGLAGTVMRCVPPLAALTRLAVTFDGDARARERPMSGLLNALADLDVRLDPPDAAALPVTVLGRGGVRGGSVQVDTSASSQFLTGLLLAASRFDVGLLARPAGLLPSRPHVDMTVQTLREWGVLAVALPDGAVRVPAGPPAGRRVRLEPDLSNAAPFLAAAVVTGGDVVVPGWPTHTTQPGADLPGLLQAMGAVVERDGDGVRVRGTGTVHGLGTLDLAHAGELTPVLAAVLALADAPTRITGVGHLRGHETDRLAALADEIGALGGSVTATDDGLEIRPTPLHGARVRSHADHRMATALAVLGLVVPGVELDDVTCTAKTMPTFPAVWAELVA
jgi:3-phosphoshikimate 1-carboxyvinyltransferase